MSDLTNSMLMARDRPLTSRNFLRFAAVCACVYLAAQLFQWIVLTFLSIPPATPEDAILYRLLGPQRARSVAVFLSFPAWLVAYAGVALCVIRRTPATAILALLFASLFVTLELAYRAVDLFVVTEQWARTMQETTDPVVQAAIADRIAVWRQVVIALYFPLLFAGCAVSALLAVGTWMSANDFLSRVFSVLLALNAIRILFRIAGMHFGVETLAAINASIYFPFTFILLGFTAVWLWRQGDESARRSGRRPGPGASSRLSPGSGQPIFARMTEG